jgi:prepilin-type N-terminal cleavage/methylation domain-containing protein
MNSKYFCNRKGFTLIELLIVIAIIIIMTGVAIPLTASYVNERQLYNAATQLQQDLLLIRNMAIRYSSGTSSKDFEIYFYPSNTYYVETTKDAAVTPGDPPVTSGKVLVRKLSSALKFSGCADGERIVFDYQGVPITHPSGKTITVSNASGSKSITVTITPIGSVLIEGIIK